MTSSSSPPPSTARRPEVVVFDVNETLSDMTGLRPRFVAVGAPGHLLEAWFAATLRDGFALTVAGATATFREVSGGVLRAMLTGLPGLTAGVEEAADRILDGFPALDLHPDVADGMRLLHDSGVRLVTLTNGSAAMSERLFDAAGVSGLVERRLSVEQAGRWKPAPQAYAFALQECGVPADRAAMVAVHPWDVDGAVRVGMTGGWISRDGGPYPGVFRPPAVSGAGLVEVARALLALPG